MIIQKLMISGPFDGQILLGKMLATVQMIECLSDIVFCNSKFWTMKKQKGEER